MNYIFKFFKNLNIGKKLVVAMVAASGLITLAITTVQIYGFYLDGLGDIDERLEEINEIHVPELSERLWLSDEASINSLLNNLIKFDGVQSIVLYDGEDEMIRSGVRNDNNTRVETYSLYYNYKDKDVKIGRLDVFVTLEDLYQEVVGKIVETLLVNATKTFLVGFLVLFVFNNLVTRHLLTISKYFNEFDIKTVEGELHLDRGQDYNNNDEIDVVVDAVNNMKSNVINSMSQIEEKNKILDLYHVRAEILIQLLEQDFEQESHLIEFALKSANDLTNSRRSKLLISGNKISTSYDLDLHGQLTISNIKNEDDKYLSCVKDESKVISSTDSDVSAISEAGVDVGVNELCIAITEADNIV
ncbi:MAG: hypothetical protein HUJ30_00135, partial [Gammaproteobacteria bacterium]|nr:hypothetical protein [Gammaproteobacteria bacterium]